MALIYEKKIAFKFKGKRSYAHGTDMYDQLLKIVKDHFGGYPSEIKGSFHQLLKNHGMFRIYNDLEPLENKSFCAFFKILVNNNICQITITKTKIPISSSYRYDEVKVTDNVTIDDSFAVMIAKPSYTYIEQIVAMTKKLHLIIYPETKGRWLFTRLQIKDKIDPALFPGHDLKVKTEKNFHYKLTQNSIFLDNTHLGNIWFSLIKEDHLI